MEKRNFGIMKRLKTYPKSILIVFIHLFLITQMRAQEPINKDDSQKNGYSDLWGNNGENWDPRGQLPDFSFAGYDMGASETPRFPVRSRLGFGSAPDPNKDYSTDLQNLINSIEKPGTILIPAGRWRIEKRVRIDVSEVVIRGENGAEFFMPKSLREVDNDNSDDSRYAFNDGFFTIQGAINYTAKKRITANANQGSKTITVENGTVYQPGDLIAIEQTDPSNESLFLYIHGSDQERLYWYENDDRCENDRLLNRKDLFFFVSRVISQNGNDITLERRLPLDVRTNWSPTVKKVNMDRTISNVGIENMIFRMNGDPFAGHFTMDGSNTIFIRNIVDSWIKNVIIYDSDNGINVKGGFNCLIENVKIEEDERSFARTTTTGHHAIWLTGCSNYLVSESEVNTRFIHDLSVEGSASQNVFSKIEGADVNIDHHRAAPYANLFTEIDMGIGSRPFASSGLPCRGAHSGRYTTYWNLKKNSGDFENFPYKAAGGGRRELSKDYNFANGVGIKGTQLDPRSESNSQFVEFTNGETLKNPNIYLAQLAKRTNTPNQIPTINFASPNGNLTVNEGYNLSVEVEAMDVDGTIATVQLFIDNRLIREERNAPYEWGHATSPQPDEISGLPVGEYEFKAIATDNQGATAESVFQLTVETSLNINSIDTNNVLKAVIFPNPGVDFVTLKMSNVVNADLTILDLSGKKMFYHKIHSESTKININFLSKGMYIVTINNNNQNKVMRLLKE